MGPALATIAIPVRSAPTRRLPLPAIYAGLAMLLAAAGYASLALGYKIYSAGEIWELVSGTGTGDAQIVLMQYRVPRAIIAPLVGAALGIAGVIVQTLSRNRIASPDTLGLNAGASLAVVIASVGFGVSSIAGLSAAAALGALLTSLLVFAIAAGSGGLSSVRIVLIGVTIAGLFSALVEVVLTVREAALDQLLFWLAGAVVDRPLSLVGTGGPIVLAGIVLALGLARPLDILQADDDTARGLGVPIGVVRAASFLAVALLTGAAVAMAGPVGFVGLVVPHAARSLAGLRHLHQIAVAGLFGAVYATLADVVARFVIYPVEAPVGAVTAVVGGCVLVVLLRRRAA
jgi:iron complex transport system permease protein